MGLAGADGSVEHEILATVDEIERRELCAIPVYRLAQMQLVVSVDILRVLEPRGPKRLGVSRSFLGLDLRVDSVFRQIQFRGGCCLYGPGEHIARQRQLFSRFHDSFASDDDVGPLPEFGVCAGPSSSSVSFQVSLAGNHQGLLSGYVLGTYEHGNDSYFCQGDPMVSLLLRTSRLYYEKV